MAGRWRQSREGSVRLQRGGREGLQAPIRVIEAMRLQMRAYESPSKDSGVDESEVD